MDFSFNEQILQEAQRRDLPRCHIRLMIDDIFFMSIYDRITVHTFKIMRDAGLTIDDDVSKSLFERIAEGVEERRYGSPIRLLSRKYNPQYR